MCGFVASFTSQSRVPLAVDVLQRMCGLIAHRGPDHEAFYTADHVALGHRRLSIIDLSDAANQPFTKGHVTLAYNGEIYNYVELARELEEQHGARFRTKSDVEVIVEAYNAFGEACVERFNGMFAFALWNAKERTLFVARDRLGVKPLFVFRQGDAVHFASDLKALWVLQSPSSRVNVDALRSFFDHSFVSTDETSSQGIFKFPAGHTCTYSARGEQDRCYWDVNAVPADPGIRFPEAVERTEALLDNALQIRLRSDVPVGCFLSGGVDSSLIVAKTAQSLGSDFHTYSIGFDDAAHDETPFIEKVLARYPTHHHHHRLDSSCLDQLPAIVYSYSELLGDASTVPMYFVSEAARQELRVVLTGDGADEMFGGYIDPFAVHLAAAYRHVPAPLRRLVSRALAAGGGAGLGRHWHRARRFDDAATGSLDDAYLRFSGGAFRGRPEAFVDGPGDEVARVLATLHQCVRTGDVDRMLYADIKERLLHDFLVKVDMGSMAHSLEARSPFLDYRLVEYGYALSPGVRYHRFERKAVLKAIARRYIDPAVINRRKMGFSIPQARWLREPRWQAVLRSVIGRRSLLDEVIARPAIERTLSEFEAGNDQEANRVWLLLWFQVWEGLVISHVYEPAQPLSALRAAA